MMKKLFLTGFFALATFAFLPAVVVHAGVGISPASIENTKLRPGTTFVKEFTFSRSNSNEELDITLEPELGAANSWVSFVPGTNFKVQKGVQRVAIIVKITVPAGATLQPLDGTIRLKVVGATKSGQSIDVIQGARIDVKLATTDATIVDFTVRSINVSDVDSSGLGNVVVKVENTGNVAGAPSKVDLDFFTFQNERAANVTARGFSTIQPGEIVDMKLNFAVTNIKKGEYYVDASVFNNDNLIRKERSVVNVNADIDNSVNSSGGGSKQFSQFLEDNKLISLLLVLLIATAFTALLVFLFRNSEERKKKKAKETHA
jgi:hypothetical protein